MGWEYALCWLTILPFEITIASMTVAFWREDINVGIWIALFLGILGAVQVFGVRGYGEGGCSPSNVSVRTQANPDPS